MKILGLMVLPLAGPKNRFEIQFGNTDFIGKSFAPKLLEGGSLQGGRLTPKGFANASNHNNTWRRSDTFKTKFQPSLLG